MKQDSKLVSCESDPNKSMHCGLWLGIEIKKMVRNAMVFPN